MSGRMTTVAFGVVFGSLAGWDFGAEYFAGVRQLELIERAWEVKERGSRPSFEGLGHTGFLVFGRWLGPPPA